METLHTVTNELAGTRAPTDSRTRLVGKTGAACISLLGRLSTVVPGVAAALALFSAFQAIAPQGPLPVLAGTASFVYFGTAFLSGSLARAVLDISAAVAAFVVAYGAVEPTTVAAAFLVHGFWGTLRSAVGTKPARWLITNWTAFSSAMALLILLD
jgi:hypothetical protein